MTTKKPADIARARLTKRSREHIALASGTTPKSLLKSPSQKHSEAGRKKYDKRAGVKTPEPPQDCYGCGQDVPGKSCNLNTCSERAMVHRCLQCGLKVRHRIVIGNPWEYCVSCRS